MNRQDQIDAAYGEIVRDAKPDDFTAAKKVRVEAIQARLNLDPEVTATERDAAMNAAEQTAPMAAEPVEPAKPPRIEGSRDAMMRKADALKLDVDPDWSTEKLAEEVAVAEERERTRLATSARLQRAADARTAKAQEAQQIVQCRIMKPGAGKISMGLHIAGQGDMKYEQDEIADLPARSVYGVPAIPPERDGAGRITKPGREGFTGYEDRGWVSVLK